MAKKKKDVYKVKPLTENKKNIITALIDEYDIQEALKDLLGYESYERSDSDNYRNGTKKKNVRGTYGEMEFDVPQDRRSTLEPQVVKKRQKDISDIDSKIISMYARGLTTRQISEQIEEIYGFECSEGFISDVTD
ncbi:MAG: IS256 family transposase, partial [Clostridiales bacterium]|nr:IS256 family transposase [Clostridiales bacterium]